MCFKNRRVRNRTHGGVGGRGRRLPLLPDPARCSAHGQGVHRTRKTPICFIYEFKEYGPAITVGLDSGHLPLQSAPRSPLPARCLVPVFSVHCSLLTVHCSSRGDRTERNYFFYFSCSFFCSPFTIHSSLLFLLTVHCFFSSLLTVHCSLLFLLTAHCLDRFLFTRPR